MTYLNAHQLVKDVQEFSETDEFGIEMKEQAVLDATQLRKLPKFDRKILPHSIQRDKRNISYRSPRSLRRVRSAERKIRSRSKSCGYGRNALSCWLRQILYHRQGDIRHKCLKWEAGLVCKWCGVVEERDWGFIREELIDWENTWGVGAKKWDVGWGARVTEDETVWAG